MDITNHAYSKMLPPESIMSYEEPASPDILIQTKKTVVYLDVFAPVNSFINNTVDSNDGTDSSSYEIESDEEDPLMVKPLPARGLVPAKPTILPQNYLKKYPNTKYDMNSYALALEEFKTGRNKKTEIVENTMKGTEISKSDSSHHLNDEHIKTEYTSKKCNQSSLRNDAKKEDVDIKLEKFRNYMNDTICVEPLPSTNLEVIDLEIASMTSSPCYSPPRFDESYSPRNEVESEIISDTSVMEEKKKIIRKQDSVKTGEKKDYSCNRPDCSFIATTRKALYCHKREKHRNNRDFLCTVCPFRTSFASDLKKHIGTHESVVVECPYNDCDYVGKHRNSLDYHKKKVHPTGSPLRCSIPGCQYTTFLPGNLKIHQIKNHGSGKTISCDQCSYRCFLIAELRKHERTHSAETPYACDFPNCQYACKISSNLRKHKRIHTEERPYACDVCSFRSNFISSLKAHKRIHTDERPYCCDQCGYRCNSASNLKKHIVQRHPGTVYEVKKGGDVFKKGQKKIDFAAKMAMNRNVTGLKMEKSELNRQMKPIATAEMKAETNLPRRETNLTSMQYSMPIIKMENKNSLSTQEWFHHHRTQHSNQNS